MFEREFEKRNYDSSSREDSKRDFGFKYWNSRNGIEQSSGVNSHWEGHWSDLSKSGRQTIKETPKNRAIEPLQLELIESKRPGFIFDRKKHRSPSRSPLKTKSPMR